MPTKTFTVADYFTPWDQLSLDQNDIDLGSGGIVLLPDQPGTTYPHLLVQVGKEGTIDLVSRDNMGHCHSGNDSQIVQTLPFAIGGIWGAPAFWNNNLYFGGQYDYLKAFSFDPNGQLLLPELHFEIAGVLRLSWTDAIRVGERQRQRDCLDH